MLKEDSKDKESLQLKDICVALLGIIHPWQALRMICFYPTQFLLHNAISRFPDLQHVYQTTKNARICVLDHLSTVKDLSFMQAMHATKSKTPTKRKTSKSKQGKAEKVVDPVLEAEVEFTVAVKSLPDSAVITSASFGAEHTTRAVAIAKRAQRDR